MIRPCSASPDIGTATVKEHGQVAVVTRTAVITTKDGPHGQKAKSAFIDRSYR